MGSPGTALAGNAVILHCLGEQILNQSLLHDLCLVSRLFNAEFSPFLYRDVRVIANRHSLQPLGNPERLRSTRSISFSGPAVAQEVNNSFVELLPLMPSLECFSWFCVPLATTTLRSLSQRPIKSLCIEYPENTTWGVLGLAIASEPDENDTRSAENRRLYTVQELSSFSNLEELTVHNMFGDLPAWRRQLATVLGQSPRLGKLRLSIAVDSIARASNHERTDDFVDFFDHLCDDYAEIGGSPLSLKILECGTAVYPTREDSLQKLVDLLSLEELRIENTDVAGDGVYLYVYDDEGQSEIPFNMFFTLCPNLRRFTASELQADVWEALCNIEPRLAQQLAVSFQSQNTWDHELADLLREDDEFPNLPLALRMTELELFRDATSNNSASDILEALVECSADSLDGLAVHLPSHSEDETDGGVLDALKIALTKLPKLSQLAIQFQGQMAADSAATLARELSSATPQLQYVGVNKLFWHITQASDQGGNDVWMHELDKREQEHVELFRGTIFRPDPI